MLSTVAFVLGPNISGVRQSYEGDIRVRTFWSVCEGEGMASTAKKAICIRIMPPTMALC
jgi:hypothetical protein